MIRPQIFQQALIVCGAVLCSISDGYIFGQMSGMLAALQSKDSDIPLSESTISWIAATINATCVCGFGLASILSEKCGRKLPVTILTVPVVAVWIMMYYAHSAATIIASRVLVGLCFGGITFLIIAATGEYSPPGVRGICLTLVNNGGSSVGTMLGHILSMFFHWRTVALLGIIPAGLSALLPCFWVESPTWLASKGKFNECEIAFRALHSHRSKAEMELHTLIELEKQNIQSSKQSSAFALKRLRSAITQRYFWKLTLLTNVISIYRVAACKMLFSTLAITMLQEMTGSSDILLFTLLVDGFAVLGACLSCFFISRMKMRTLLFSSACIANVFLVALSACMYFSTGGNVYMPWINCTLLALYFITVNAGPYPVLEALFGEIFPTEIKGFCVFIFGTMGGIFHFLSIKFASDMFTLMGYHGVFLLNAIIMCLCLAYFWLKLPETKGRTLQEIELYFKYDTFEKVDDILKGEQTKLLMLTFSPPRKMQKSSLAAHATRTS